MSILELISSFALRIVNTLGYPGVFLLMTLQSANIPVPSEFTMIFSGFLVSVGRFSFWPVVLMGTLGNVLGSLISYAIAYRYGRSGMEKLAAWHLVSVSRIEKGAWWFERFGLPVVFVGRMLPLVSTFISFPAGLYKVKLAPFIGLTFLGSFFWSTFLVYVGNTLGENWQDAHSYFRQFDYLILMLLVIGGILGVYGHFKNSR